MADGDNGNNLIEPSVDPIKPSVRVMIWSSRVLI